MRWLWQTRRKVPKVALVICVRNEERFIAANLLYHQAIGVERAYVFMDRCTDGTEDIVSSLPWVRPIRIREEDSARITRVGDLHSLCMDRALELARHEGIDWLLTLDADEFAVPSPLNQTTEGVGSLAAMLAKAPRRAEVVQLLPQETLPIDLNPSSPFWEQRAFLIDQNLRREAYDSIDDTIHEWFGNTGHTCGKAIVRTRADVQANGSHGWTRNQHVSYPQMPGSSTLRVFTQPGLLHYAIVDRKQWFDKYYKLSAEGDCYRNGAAIEFPKRAWTRMAGVLTPEQSDEYFREWVATPADRLQQLIAAGSAIENDDVPRTLCAAGHLVGGTLRLPQSTGKQPIEDWHFPASTWRDAAQVARRQVGSRVVYRIADLPPDDVRGTRWVASNGRDRYRWMLPRFELQLDIEPANYSLILRFAKRTPRGQLLGVSIDGEQLDSGRWTETRGNVQVSITKADLSRPGRHCVGFEFSPVRDARQQANQRGPAVVEIEFDRIPQRPTKQRAAA